MEQVVNATTYDVITDNVSVILVTSSNDSASVDTAGCKLYRFIVESVVIGLLCVLGVTGNTMSFIVFRKDTLKTSTTFLFQGLSITDSFLLVMAIPVYSVPSLMEYLGNEHFEYYVKPYIAAYVFPWLCIAQTAAIWVTVLVGVNRYISVCWPYHAQRWTNLAKARQYLTIVLLLSFLYNIPHFVTRSIKKELNEYNETVPIMDENTNKTFEIIYYNICYTLIMLLLPLGLLVFLSHRLIRALKALKAKRASMQSQERQDSNVTFTLVIVLLVFTVCQAPALLTQIFWSILPDSQRLCGGFQHYYSRVSNALVILNSAINFVLYAGTNKRFRTVLLTQVCHTKVHKANGTNHQTQLLTQATQM